HNHRTYASGLVLHKQRSGGGHDRFVGGLASSSAPGTGHLLFMCLPDRRTGRPRGIGWQCVEGSLIDNIKSPREG
ncbi:MAG: hypothetical protein QNJ29_14840, partial [Rhizobiaceae bacterium]|nr:hypothetical protein [Rhizobiaceae bacterium]